MGVVVSKVAIEGKLESKKLCICNVKNPYFSPQIFSI